MTTPLQLLAAQIAVHQRYSEHTLDLRADVRTVLALTGGENVIDIGCGTGEFLCSLRDRDHRGTLLGVDIRPDAVRATAALDCVQAVLGEATHLPVADDSVDRVVMMHMLYYLQLPNTGLVEMGRVTRAGGVVAVSLDHLTTAPRLRALVIESAAQCGYAPRTASQVWAHTPTGAELDPDTAADLIRTEFGNVEMLRRDSALVFPTVEAVMEHARVIACFTCAVPDQPYQLGTVLAPVQQQVCAQFFRTGGPWRGPKGYTVFRARVS